MSNPAKTHVVARMMPMALGSASLAACVLLVGWFFLFRPVVVTDFQGEKIRVKQRWGRPTLVEIDRNSDGMIDYIGIPNPKGDLDDVLVVTPTEFWSDDDFDGVMEIHIVLGLESERPARVFEVDQDGDGIPDVILTGGDADAAYLNWLGKHAADPIRGPQTLRGVTS